MGTGVRMILRTKSEWTKDGNGLSTPRGGAALPQEQTQDSPRQGDGGENGFKCVWTLFFSN